MQRTAVPVPVEEALPLRARLGDLVRRSAWVVAFASLFAPAIGTRLMGMIVTIDSESALLASLTVPPIIGLVAAVLVSVA